MIPADFDDIGSEAFVLLSLENSTTLWIRHGKSQCGMSVGVSRWPKDEAPGLLEDPETCGSVFYIGDFCGL